MLGFILLRHYPANAAPNPGVVSGTTATFTGDQHLGITSVVQDLQVPPDFSTQTIDTLIIKLLSQDIDPWAVYTSYDAAIFMTFTGKDGVSAGKDTGPGENGKNLTIQYDGGDFTLKGGELEAVLLESTGGHGGSVIPSDTDGHPGGAGGNGGNLSFTSTSGDIENSKDYGCGIILVSNGQDGGKGGEHQQGTATTGGHGGAGGIGGSITVDSSSKIIVFGRGILAESTGGNGNTGGVGDSPGATGGTGGTGGAAGPVTITNRADITTTGMTENNQGIYAVSEAGNGGKGGDTVGSNGTGGAGGAGGAASQVKVTNLAGINTAGYQSQGVLGQSVGGAGGDGGSGSGALGDPGGAQKGGNGGQVIVDNSGIITTTGETSEGIFAQSVGGFAGDAGSSRGLVTYGANDQSGGAGGEVHVSNEGTVTTSGKYSDAVFAQSVGGGGGAGSSSTGLFFSMGGQGSAGGSGGTVNVTNTGTLQTTNDDANGIFAQSVGGGGGHGGEVGSISGGFAVALGGGGGDGGDGGQVNISPPDTATATISNTIDTSGKNASGIFAQSMGGGGGNGGYAMALSAGLKTCSIALGGKGGKGGVGGEVTVNNSSAIHTRGENAYGIFAESLGGGGGVGGASVTSSVSATVTHNISIGGAGGDGGGADATHTQIVSVKNSGDITTDGVNATGILAQSVGGGGGAGGYSSSVSLSPGKNTTFSIGGKGGGGGSGGAVYVTNNNKIATSGKMAPGVLAQSAGGGGGNGGFSLNLSSGAIQGGISIGGSGDKDKGGGNGGYVNVTNRADITIGSSTMICGDSTTCADPDADPALCSCGLSYGILAQSVGGGGGHGGYSFTGGIGIGAFDFALGGAGGKGGYAGLVDVYNYGGIETYANGSHGILAQSVGGGGGTGGAATSVAMSFAFSVDGIPIPGAGLSLAVGGTGGGGGGADSTHTQKVTVNNYNSILTHAEGSAGILAQSIGGGGGDGGWAAAGAGSISEGETVSVNIALGHGGTGGTGGKGGEVNVNNQGTVQSMKENSPGILAQSIGGGGGNGGLSVAATMSYSSQESATFNSAVSIGGAAGDAGPASKVTVTSSAPVSTAGYGSSGIMAQSIGGGGGKGGASITGTLSLGKSPDTAQLQESIGGWGGGGGNADSVYVSLTGNGSVTTQGKKAMGIWAQSIGGGGGEGGMSFNGNFANNKTKKLSFSVGGTGGEGGNGSSVTVSSADNTSISTSGSHSHGIMAQSIGGGGGAGGLSGNGSFSIRKGEGDSISFSLAIGGAGGVAGNGGAITMNDTYADITTTGDRACGIKAQSIGGGGGEGGGSFSANINWTPKEGSESTPQEGENAPAGEPDGEEDVELEIGITVGGKGGVGGAGGTVGLDNYGNINTSGDKSHGIFAQSVGGGGGNGGEAEDFALIKTDYAITPEKISGLTITVGGNGGTGNYGSKVAINNFGGITTHGDYAKGILAQSIGGGGGDGGSTGGKTRRSTLLPDNLSVTVGGTAGGSSIGGEVDVTNNGTITTFGEGAYGIQAQSVGGGGGNGGEGEMGLLTLTLALGGYAGSGSHGGLVNVINSGVIDTSGDGAHGIFAQSVGGGGGLAGNVARFSLIETEEVEISIGIGIGWAPSKGGHGGDGGKVLVTNNSDITTRGASAYGILAQSVGGGGGEGGEVGWGPGAYINYFMGSVGGDGYGGEVDVNHNAGKITTLGEDSIGIFAQSAGGANTGGTVDIGVSDDVICSGADSYGIVGQSIGKAGNGNVWVTIASGATVQSGTGGAGVKFLDGASNHLKNSGTLATSDGINGMAVESVVSDGGTKTPGNETIENYGLITGSVDLGGGANSFHNYADGTFVSGPKINLGGYTLTNEGIINPGGSSGALSVLAGNFTQTYTGYFQTTLYSNGKSGQLQVMGMANLDGTLALTYGSDPFTTSKTYNVLMSMGRLGEFSDEINPAPLLNVTTTYLPTGVQLTVTPQSLTTVAQNSHQMLLGQYYDEALLSSGHEFGKVLGKIQTLTKSEFGSAFNSLSPAIYDANTFTAFDVSRQYVNTVQERLRKVRQNSVSQAPPFQTSNEKSLLASNDSDSGLSLGSIENRSQKKRLGVSVNGFGRFGDADEADGLSGFDYDMGGTALGVDYALNDHMVVGAGFGYADTEIDLDGGFGSGDIDSYMGSIYGTYFIDRAYLEGVFTYGDHSYDNDRKISIGDIQDHAESEHDADAFSGLMEAGYNFSVCNLSMQPFASLFYSYLDEESFQESGANPLNMHIGSSQTDGLTSELGFRASQSFTTSKGILTPEFTAAWQYDYDVDRHTMRTSYAGSPLVISIKGREQPNSALFGAGLSFTSNCGIIASLQYDGEIAEEFTAHGVFGQIRVPF